MQMESRIEWLLRSIIINFQLNHLFHLCSAITKSLFFNSKTRKTSTFGRKHHEKPFRSLIYAVKYRSVHSIFN